MSTASSFVVLLRGVNVGGHRKVPAADLRAIAAEAGLANAKTLLNSGNLVAAPGSSGVKGPDDVTRLVRDGLLERLGLEVDVLTVTGTDLDATIAANPFPDVARDEPSRLLLTFYPEAPDPERTASFDPAPYGPEQIRWVGAVSFTWYPDGAGSSKLTPAVLARAFGGWGTARNWNTVTKLAALAAARG